MSAQVVLIIAGLIFIAAAIVGGGNFVKVILPNLPVWARVISAGIGVTAFILGLAPSIYTTSTVVPNGGTTPAPQPSTPAPNPIPTSPSPSAPQITLTCTLGHTQIRPGATIDLTYNMNSTATRQVGLGAGLYDEQGNDHSNGDGDISSFTLKQGSGSPSRPVTIPARLPPGRYELDAEIWPANQIGQNGVNDFVDAPCAHFTVP